MFDEPGTSAVPTGAGVDRRRFLAAAAAALAAAAAPRDLMAQTPLRRAGGITHPAEPGVGAAAERLDRIGLQLYTIRGEVQRDFAGSLARVAKIGYGEVEFAGYFDHAPKDVRAILDANGLKAPAAHVALDRLRTEPERVIEEAHVVGHEYIVCPWLDEKEHTPDGFARLADTLQQVAVAARPAGIGVAYHNHDFEFKPFPDGRKPYDVLMERLAPGLVRLELDLFWAVKGGADPLELFGRAPGHFPMVHVKDMDRAGGMTDVGKGTIEWARIFAEHKRAGIRHYFVEHDEPADPWASVTASYQYLRQLTFPAAA